MLCFAVRLFLASPNWWCVVFSLPLCSLCVLLEHALKHYFPTCGNFAIDLEHAQACFLVLSRCSCCAAVCVWFCAKLAKQWRKIVEGFLRSEKSIFPFFSLFSASFSYFFFLFHWRARDTRTARKAKTSIGGEIGHGSVLFAVGVSLVRHLTH